MTLKTFRTRSLAVAAVGALSLTGTALAAHPKASKKYGGGTSEAKVNGKRPTVTFRVSKDARKLVNFTYQTVGCFAGATQSKQDLGTLAVSRSGAFSVKNALSRQASGARTVSTRSTVSGRFKSSSTATGTITFTQTVSERSGPQIKPCGPKKVSFTAKAASSAGGGISGGY
jgi:hypothetical protein